MRYLSNHFIKKILMILGVIYLLLKISNMVDLKSLLFIDNVNAYQNTGDYPNFWFYYQNFYDGTFQYEKGNIATDFSLNTLEGSDSSNSISLPFIPLSNQSYVWIYFYNSLQVNHNYSVSYNFCDFNVVKTPNTFFLRDNRFNLYYSNDNSGNHLWGLTPTTHLYNGQGFTFKNCYQIHANFDAIDNAEFYQIGLNFGSSTTNNLYLLGYKFHDNGISNTFMTNILSSINRVYDYLINDVTNQLSLIYYKIDTMEQNIIDNATENSQNEIDNANKNQEQTNKRLDEVNDNLTSTDTEGANSSAGGFFNDFEDKDYGLSDVITMPLTFIKGVTNTTCSPLSVPLPFVDTNAELPCMNTIYSQYFGGFLSIYQIITTGLISYWVCINIYAMVKGFKDPDSDKVEVMDL